MNLLLACRNRSRNIRVFAVLRGVRADNSLIFRGTRKCYTRAYFEAWHRNVITLSGWLVKRVRIYLASSRSSSTAALYNRTRDIRGLTRFTHRNVSLLPDLRRRLLLWILRGYRWPIALM